MMKKIDMSSETNLTKEIIKLIETLSHSGLPQLDNELFGKLKRICKKSPCSIKFVYETILKQLKKNHAEIRLTMFQLIIEFLKRSHDFRLLVITDLEVIVELTINTDPAKRLPPPKNIAEKLRKLAILNIHKWKEDFGADYKQFTLCYNYLLRSKNVDFDSVLREINDDQIRLAEQERKVQQIRNEMLSTAKEEFEAIKSDCENSVETLKNCLDLLIPAPDDFFLPTEDDCMFTSNTTNSEGDDDNFNLRQFGLSSSYNLVIELNHHKKVKIDRTEENAPIIDNLRDNIKLIKRQYLGKIKKFSDVIKNNKGDSNLLKEIDFVKQEMVKGLCKVRELSIENIDNSSNEEDDDDFEEVIKDGYEANVLDDQPGCSKNLPSVSRSIKVRKSDELKDSSKIEKVTCIDGKELVESNQKRKASSVGYSDRKKRLLAIAPKVPYDIDLYHWEDDNLTAPTLRSTKLEKFWGTADEIDEIPNPDGIAALRTRVIEFTGKFEPVKWSCRAPLPSGRLCPRFDRIRCPFHGKIVPRNEKGECVRPEDEKPTDGGNEIEEEEPVPDWQDPKLLAELKAATGIDLKMPDKKKNKKKIKKKGDKKKPTKRRKKGQPSSEVLEEIQKRNFPGLTDIDNSKEKKKRLKKKIFNRSTMKRVAAATNKLGQRRHDEKFGDQFNYVHGTA